MSNKQNPLERLKHHVTGAIERGEKQAIAAQPVKRRSEGPWTVEVHQDTTSVEGKYQTVAVDVSNSDADLIAAAPELLEVLQRLVVSLPLRGNSVAVEYALNDACRAIAKAKGGK